MERTRSLTAARRAACSLLCLAALAACAKAPASFGAVLAFIDSGAPGVTIDTFLNAAALAGGTEERLRLLKRASTRDPGFAADVADAVISSVTPTESVALVAFDLFLAAGRYRDAQSLFESGLRFDERPLLYAELLVSSGKAGETLWPPLAAVPLIADASGHPEFLLDGAVAALRDGNAPAARELLKEAVDRGLSVSERVLWDAGLLERLSLASLEVEDPEGLELSAGAAYLTGNTALAAQGYARIVERYPGYSWRPWAALARLGAVPPIPEYADPLARADRPDAGASADASGQAFLYESMAARFGNEPDAVREYARWLIEVGEMERARALLTVRTAGDARGAAMFATLDGSIEPTKSPSIAAGLAARWPESPEAIDTALALLFGTGAWDDYRRLRSRTAGLDGRLPRQWFWEAVDALDAGDPATAIQILKAAETDRDDFSAAFALGMASLAAGRTTEAATVFRTAASKPSSGPRKALALAWAGNAFGYSSAAAEAMAMYRAALNADPACLEARIGLGSLDAARP